MRAVKAGEVGAASVAVDRLLDTLSVAVADRVDEQAPVRFLAASTTRCTPTGTLSSTVSVSIANVLRPVWSTLSCLGFVLSLFGGIRSCSGCIHCS